MKRQVYVVRNKRKRIYMYLRFTVCVSVCAKTETVDEKLMSCDENIFTMNP